MSIKKQMSGAHNFIVQSDSTVINCPQFIILFNLRLGTSIRHSPHRANLGLRRRR